MLLKTVHDVRWSSIQSITHDYYGKSGRRDLLLVKRGVSQVSSYAIHVNISDQSIKWFPDFYSRAIVCNLVCRLLLRNDMVSIPKGSSSPRNKWKYIVHSNLSTKTTPNSGKHGGREQLFDSYWWFLESGWSNQCYQLPVLRIAWSELHFIFFLRWSL